MLANCLEIGDVASGRVTAEHFCGAVVADAAVPGHPFWNRVEVNLLKALVLYVAGDLPRSKQSMNTVLSLLRGEPERLGELFGELPKEHPARLLYSNVFCEGSRSVLGSAISGLSVRLQSCACSSGVQA